VTWEPNPDRTIRVRGEVANTSDAAITEAAVAVVLHDAAGEALAGAYDVSLGPLDAGASAIFETDYPGTPTVDPTTIATADASAFGLR
jgi:hypothetical protein